MEKTPNFAGPEPKILNLLHNLLMAKNQPS